MAFGGGVLSICQRRGTTARKVREKGKTPPFLASEESAPGSFSSFPSSKIIGEPQGNLQELESNCLNT
jgi:hypothetical protein